MDWYTEVPQSYTSVLQGRCSCAMCNDIPQVPGPCSFHCRCVRGKVRWCQLCRWRRSMLIQGCKGCESNSDKIIIAIKKVQYINILYVVCHLLARCSELIKSILILHHSLFLMDILIVKVQSFYVQQEERSRQSGIYGIFLSLTI